MTGECEPDPARAVQKMTETLRNRGPDSAGEWADRSAGIALGHRRLSILDLSVEGAQPMRSASGRFVITFNGEIYNFADLRRELIRNGASFRGRSDTEVMLAAFEHWGITGALQRFAGMFAFALWDSVERRLYLARDRFGEKPLYYGSIGKAFLFGSEIRALRQHPSWKGEIDRDALEGFVRYGYVPAPRSIYRGIRKVMPGSVLTISERGSSFSVEQERYWSLATVASRGLLNPVQGDDSYVIDVFEARLRETIRQEMVADVPVGAFLSGGVDSSAVVALMQAESSRPLRTFTIGFRETAYDEAKYARAVAQHVGTDHTELYLTPCELADTIPKLTQLYDEPFADASQIPTYLVAQLARRSVTVSLSGDGADELLGGYNRYVWGERIEWATRKIPLAWRRLAARLTDALMPAARDRVFQIVSALTSRKGPTTLSGDKLEKLLALLAADSPANLYNELRSGVTGRPPMVLGALSIAGDVPDSFLAIEKDFALRAMYIDQLTSLPDDILVKIDRATMGVSLELRAPFLDHRLAELAWRLPKRFKLRGAQRKWILRKVAEKYIPRSLLDRPKMGFCVPLAGWLRGPLKDWASDLLDPGVIRSQGFLDAGCISRIWAEHQSGHQNKHEILWRTLMFQSWLADV